MSSLSAVFLNKRHEIQRLAEVAERFCAEHHLSNTEMLAASLALDEAVTNTILHGYDDDADHEITVRMALDAGVLTLEVEDDARPFDPLQAPAPNLDLPIEERPIGGLGIYFVRTLMDDVEYQRRGDRNVLTMRKTIARTDSA